MVIIEAHRILALSNPKCFSTSVRHALRPYGSVVLRAGDYGLHPHMTAREVKAKVFPKRNWDWDDWYKFTFCRNPFDLLRSRYLYGKFDGVRHWWDEGWSPEKVWSFERWFWEGKTLDRDTRSYTASKASMSVASFSGKLLDRIFTENDVSDFENELSRRIGRSVTIGAMNPSERKDVLFTRSMVEKVRQDFSWEFETFGYDEAPLRPPLERALKLPTHDRVRQPLRFTRGWLWRRSGLSLGTDAPRTQLTACLAGFPV